MRKWKRKVDQCLLTICDAKVGYEDFDTGLKAFTELFEELSNGYRPDRRITPTSYPTALDSEEVDSIICMQLRLLDVIQRRYSPTRLKIGGRDE